MEGDLDFYLGMKPESDTNPRLNTAGIQLYQSKVGSTLGVAIGTRPEVQSHRMHPP